MHLRLRTRPHQQTSPPSLADRDVPLSPLDIPNSLYVRHRRRSTTHPVSGVLAHRPRSSVSRTSYLQTLYPDVPLYWPHFTRRSPPLRTGNLPDMNIRTGRDGIRVSITVTCSAYCSVMCNILLPFAADPALLHAQAHADILKLTWSPLLLSHPALDDCSIEL